MKLVVVSLFDGISGGRFALERTDIEVLRYYSSEIDKYPIQIADSNFPQDTPYRLGDVTKIDGKALREEIVRDFGENVEILMTFGFPCQSYSAAGKREGLNSKNGNLIYEVFRLLEDVKPTYILGENVKGLLSIDKGETYKFILSELESLGYNVEYTVINSALLSAQNRERVYITNWKVSQPEDKGLILKDILEDNVDNNYNLSSKNINFMNGVWCNTTRWLKMKNPIDGKAGAVCATMSKGLPRGVIINDLEQQNKVYKTGVCELKDFNKNTACHHIANATDLKGYDSLKRVYASSGKAPTVVSRTSGNTEPKVLIDKVNPTYRKLTPLECERLQTLPDNSTAFGVDTEGNIVKMSNTQRYKAIGNGWTIDVIAHILQELYNAKNTNNKQT